MLDTVPSQDGRRLALFISTLRVLIRQFGAAAQYDALSFAKTSSRLSGRRPMLFATGQGTFKETVDRREASSAGRSGRHQRRRTFWGVGRRAARRQDGPDRGEPIKLDQAARRT